MRKLLVILGNSTQNYKRAVVRHPAVGEGLAISGKVLRLALAASFAVSSCAQAPATKPAAADAPRFEIRRFVFEGAALVSSEQLEAATQAFAGAGRTFS